MPSLSRLEAFGDDLLARLEPLLDDPERVDPRADLHVPERDLAVGADDGDAVKILQFLHGALRHEERAGLGVERAPARGRTGPAAGRSGIGEMSWTPSVPVEVLTARSTGPTVPCAG